MTDTPAHPASLPAKWRKSEDNPLLNAGQAGILEICAEQLEASLRSLPGDLEAVTAQALQIAGDLERRAENWQKAATTKEIKDTVTIYTASAVLIHKLLHALQSAALTGWQTCAVTKKPHKWECWFDGGPPDCSNPNHHWKSEKQEGGVCCHDCRVLRSAIAEPAKARSNQTALSSFSEDLVKPLSGDPHALGDSLL